MSPTVEEDAVQSYLYLLVGVISTVCMVFFGIWECYDRVWLIGLPMIAVGVVDGWLTKKYWRCEW